MGYNTEALDYFAAGIADIQLNRNPLASEAVIILNDVERDHYQDASMHEVSRVKKRVIVKKDVDMDYLQQGDFFIDDQVGLLEDTDHLPWMIGMTITGLPRKIKLDDQILIEGLLYTVSAVRPINRSLRSMQWAFVYTDRTDYDPLNLFSITELEDGSLDLLYGGAPVSLGFSYESVGDKSLRVPFISTFYKPEHFIGEVYIFDKDNNFKKYTL